MEVPTQFQFYPMDPAGERAGKILNEVQSRVIQNRIAIIAQQKINCKFDPLNPIAFAQVEAMLGGKIDALQELLNDSAETLAESKQSQKS